MQLMKEPCNTSILVVDDDSNIRKLMFNFLDKEGYAVELANDGEQAIERINEQTFELIITDLQMEPVSGLDVLKASKTKDKHTQVLIFTGHGSISSAVKAMKAGAYEYLTKPIEINSFLQKVKNGLEKRHLQLLLEEQQTKLDQYHRTLSRDLALAKQVQSSLVPKYFEDKHILAAVKYVPMIGLGGDFADIYDDGKQYTYLTVIDVTGHGISAALLVNRICSEIRKLVRDGLAPDELLGHLNRFFCESLGHTGLFLTIFSTRVDRFTHKLQYAASAHPAALLYRAEDKKIVQLFSQNFIIGFEDKGIGYFKSDEIEYQPGDALLLYTDGLIEAENEKDKPFGVNRLIKSFDQFIEKPVYDLSESLMNTVKQWGNGRLRDDVLIFITKFRS